MVNLQSFRWIRWEMNRRWTGDQQWTEMNRRSTLNRIEQHWTPLNTIEHIEHIEHSNTATQQHSNTATLLYHVSLWYQGAETGYRVRTPYRSDVKHKWGHRGQLSPIWTHFFSSLTKSWGGEGIQQKQNIQLLGTNNPIGSLPSQILCSLWTFE